MIQNIKDGTKVYVNVFLKNGSIYKECNIPNNPFDVGECFSFWAFDKLMIYPFSQIDHIEFCED